MASRCRKEKKMKKKISKKRKDFLSNLIETIHTLTLFEVSLWASMCAQVLAVLDASITTVDVFRHGTEQF